MDQLQKNLIVNRGMQKQVCYPEQNNSLKKGIDLKSALPNKL